MYDLLSRVLMNYTTVNSFFHVNYFISLPMKRVNIVGSFIRHLAMGCCLSLNSMVLIYKLQLSYM